MEGYLDKKATDEKNYFVQRRDWRKRWCILEGCMLTFYENFDVKNERPVNMISQYNIQN